MKVKVMWSRPNLSVSVVLFVLSLVLDKESVDSKVLVQTEINQIQKYSLDCSKKR